MKKYTYNVLAFRQQEHSPIQVAFVANAGQVMEWAGVPRKNDELLTGYQRFRDDNRINQEIVPFFQNSKNCSPTAIIVALRRDAGLGRCSIQTTELPVGEVRETVLEIEFDDESLGTDKMFEAAVQYVNARLGNNNQINEEEELEEEDEVLSEEEDEDDNAELATGDTVEIVHLGTTTLVRMRELLEDKRNWTRPEFQTAISDYVKPASIIDGQHRISAAAKIGVNGLPFIICGLFDASWEEQVFQFTVVNLKPKRIAPSIITSIAGLSLTRTEQDAVERRLKQAGINVAEVTYMSLVSYDDRSPFAEKVDMSIAGPKDKEEKLGYGAMKRITKEWYNANRNSLTQIAKGVYNTNSVSRARSQWRTDRAWFDFFSMFWSSVREHYPPNLWQKTPENRLFIGAHLWALQEVILRQADNQIASVWRIDDSTLTTEERISLLQKQLLEVVGTTLIYFPTEMWTIPWKRASQDTNAGRTELVEFLNEFIDQGKRTGFWKNWKKSSWFAPTSTQPEE